MMEVVTRTPAKAAVGFAATRHALLEASRRNAEVVQAMGMGGAMSARYRAVNDQYVRSQRRASDRAGMLGRYSRVLRLTLQSFVLGIGAYLVIEQEATAGVIIASAILMSRALAPVELAIANWKGFVAARQARQRLSELLPSCHKANNRCRCQPQNDPFCANGSAQVPLARTHRRAGCHFYAQER